MGKRGKRWGVGRGLGSRAPSTLSSYFEKYITICMAATTMRFHEKVEQVLVAA